MRTRGAIMVCVSVLAIPFCCGTLMAASLKLDASDGVRALGVKAYVLNRASQVTTIDLLSSTKRIGFVATMRTFDGMRMISIDREDTFEHLRLYWDGHGVTIDAGDGVLHLIGMDRETGELRGDDIALELFRRHISSFKLAAAVTDDVLSRTSKFATHSEMTSQGGYLPPDMFEPTWWLWWDMYLGGGGDGWLMWQTSDLICNGPTVRGEAFAEQGDGINRSTICESAKNNANTKCWNSYCTGCCQLSSCDAFCFLGDDYLCVTAGVNGTACSLAH
jgi:hypothetical protein